MPKNPEGIKLSILMLSIPSRIEQYLELQNKILEQIGDREDVELICLLDNKSLHIYEKRNELLRTARGKFLTWLDDDDDIARNYIDSITSAIQKNPEADVISFNQKAYLNGESLNVFAKMGNPHEPVRRHISGIGFTDCKRPPYHWCVWNSNLAKSESFNENYSHTGQSCEDIDWLRRLYPKVNNEIHLDEFLHIYRWSSETTESVVRQ